MGASNMSRKSAVTLQTPGSAWRAQVCKEAVATGTPLQGTTACPPTGTLGANSTSSLGGVTLPAWPALWSSPGDP